MKKILCAVVLLLSLFVLSGCSDAPKVSQYSFEDVRGGVMIKAVTVRSRTLEIPESYKGKPVVAIADSAFYRSEELRKVVIPASVKTIGTSAFADCEKLNTLIFEKGGSCSISESAFQGCTLLKTVDLNGSVVSIGERAFMNCKQLSKLRVGKELTEIGIDAFMGCEQMLFLAEEGSYAEEYAKQNHLITDFTKTDTYFYICIGGGVVLGILLILLYNFLAKKRKKNKKTS